MAAIPLTLRVHATGCAFPMCDTPQALDIGADGESGEMLVYRVSGEHRTLLDTGSAIAIWSRWLPAAWGIRSIVDRSTVGLHGESNWSCMIGENASVHLTTPKCGPPITIAAKELEAALLVMGGPTVEGSISVVEFPEHRLEKELYRVVRHNHRIHEIAQEVEEIDL